MHDASAGLTLNIDGIQQGARQPVGAAESGVNFSWKKYGPNYGVSSSGYIYIAATSLSPVTLLALNLHYLT